MGSVSSPWALPIYFFTLAHGFIPLLDTPLCVPPWAKRPMIAHTYHNKECTVLARYRYMYNVDLSGAALVMRNRAELMLHVKTGTGTSSGHQLRC